MTIEIHMPDLEGLILRRLQSGQFQSVEEMLLQALGGETPKGTGPVSAGAKRRIEEEAGVPVLHTGEPLSRSIVEDTLDAVRGERDFANLGPLRCNFPICSGRP
jgi:hypothetical protein